MNCLRVFEYGDFRKYISGFQKWKQREDKRFNKINFSKLLGLPNTRSYFTNVLGGRSLTPAFVERFINVLSLGKVEAMYFMALVKINKANTTDERELYFDKFISLNKMKNHVLDRGLFENPKLKHDIRASIK